MKKISKTIVAVMVGIVAVLACLVMVGTVFGAVALAIPGVDPHMIPGVDPHYIPGVDPHMIPGVDPHMIPGVDPH
jgi:hypothetical protein